VFKMTEASAATSQENTAYTAVASIMSQVAQVTPRYGYNTTKDAAGLYYARRIGRLVTTMDAGGDHVYVEMVPALAGYYGVVKITSIKCSMLTAAGILTFQSPAATAALPNVENQPVLNANVRDINMQGLVVTHATLTDNQAIGVVFTDFGTPGVCIVEIMYEWWYET
jgi:hypothetical protein